MILASGAAWIIVTGALPQVAIARPRIEVRVVLLAVIAGVGGTVLGLATTGVPGVAVAVGGLCAAVPVVHDRRRRRRADQDRLAMWPHILTQVRSSLSSGATLTDALIDALERSGGSFAPTANTIRTEATFGDGFAAAIARVRNEADDPTADRILVTLGAAHAAGGTRVGTIVGLLARSVADEVRVQRAHEAALTEQRMTVNVALIAPWVMLILMVATNPQAADAFSTGQGMVIMAIGAVATVTGWALAMRMARLSQPPRVFR